MRLQEFLDALPQAGIISASLSQKRSSSGVVSFQSLQENGAFSHDTFSQKPDRESPLLA
jgi:hypothetical protein